MISSERPDDRVASAFRFATELFARVSAPWALAPYSVPPAVVTLVLELPRWRWLLGRQIRSSGGSRAPARVTSSPRSSPESP